MRRLASRPARAAAFFVDCLLLALIPALFFYPAYFFLIPAPLPPPLLPDDLLTQQERLEILNYTARFAYGMKVVGIGCVLSFFLTSLVYQTTFVWTRGQTFGMAASSIKVMREGEQRVSWGRAFLRALLVSLGATAVLGIVVALETLLVEAAQLTSVTLKTALTLVSLPRLYWLLISAAGRVLLLPMLLIPRRHIPDICAGTRLVALSGDIFDKEQ